MFSTGFPQFALFLLGVFLCLSVVALISLRQFNLERRVGHALSYLQTQNKASLSLSRLAEIETTLTELTDAYDSLLQSHKKLRNKIGMRHLREDRKSESVPDPRQDPAGYKREMRLKLANGTLHK